jgi:hypothetical protein
LPSVALAQFGAFEREFIVGTSNITARSGITLGGVTRTTWPTGGGSSDAITNATGPGITVEAGILTLSTNDWQFGAAQTPWTTNIDAGGFSLLNVGTLAAANIQFGDGSLADMLASRLSTNYNGAWLVGSGGLTNNHTSPVAVGNSLTVNGQLVGQPLVLPRFKAQMEEYWDNSRTNVQVVVFGDSITPAAVFAAQAQAALGWGGPGFVTFTRNPYMGSSGHRFWLFENMTGWTTNERVNEVTAWGIGGNSIVGGSNATVTAHTASPKYLCDRISVWFHGSSTGGTFRVVTPTAAVTNTIDTSLYSGLSEYKFTVPAAAHTNVITVMSGSVRLYGIRAESTTLGGPIFDMMAHGGSTAREWVQYGQYLSNYVASVGAPLVLCTLGYNDVTSTQAVADITQLRSWFPNSDFAAVYPYGVSNQVMSARMVEVVNGLRANGVAVIDQTDVYPYTLMDANGWLADGLHASPRGADATGLELLARLQAAIGKHWHWWEPVPAGEGGISTPVLLRHSRQVFGTLDPITKRFVIGSAGMAQGSGPFDSHPGFRVSSYNSGIFWIYNLTENGGISLHNGVFRVGTGSATPLAFYAGGWNWGSLSSAGAWNLTGTMTISAPTTISNNITGTGNLTLSSNLVARTVTATAFVGDGSGLTNVNAATLGGVALAGLVQTNAALDRLQLNDGGGLTNLPSGGSTGMRVMLTPGGALTFGSISNALIVGTAAATGYGINTDTLQFDPTTPQLAPWQMPVISYTGGAVNVAITWSEPTGGAATNVWEFWTAQAVSNAALPSAWTVSAVITQQVNQTATNLSVWTGTITPSWTNSYPAPAFFGLFRNSTNTADNAASTSSVYGVTLWQ